MSEAATKPKKKKTQAPTPQMTALLDIISPTAIHFKPKDLVFGELYQTIITVTDYPPRVGAAWLSRVATLPGVVVSIHAQPTDPIALIQQITVSMGELSAKLQSSGSPVVIERSEQQYLDAKTLLKKIDSEQQNVFYITVVMVVSANDPDELQQRKKRVESILSAAGMRGRTPMFRQEEGLRAAGPFKILEPEIADIGARNMPVETIAASYPFVYSGINDGKGVLLGTDRSGGIVLIDFWMREGSRTNTNMTVMGRPGVGKSTTIKKILMNEFAQGTKIIIIDPEREYRDLCKNLGGDWIDCGGGRKGRINPFQVRVVPEDDDDDEEEKFYSSELSTLGPLALHFQTLRTFYRLYLKNITKIQQGLLEVAWEEIYKAKGITWNTDPLTIQNHEWPDPTHLFEYVDGKSKEENADPEWRQLATMLRASAIGADQALWAGETTIKADSDFVVLDIHTLLGGDEEIRKAQFFNVLSWAWSEIAKDRTQKVILAVDEAYLLVDPDTPQALQFLRNTSKRIRKYEGALMVITHNMVDFMDPAVQRYGQALIDNPVYKLIMGQGDKDIEALTKLMTLSEREIQTLTEGKRGEALLVAGNRRIHAKIDVTDFELEMFGKGGGR
ncbi:VirB4 family type IV secretion system protein [Paenibacillus tyrfis]|uniref:VirB4 family type IV secretion system protein n=1 Tax=Paenibacillus tyrfis TaxID=1501230 RepID=UPI0020A0FE10|nr:DUF87 domain-containing protein [Paenibacillus tyrfis]MCP1312091.1 DUF87 domain-containing protein [Paenibacillus tyrfis]